MCKFFSSYKESLHSGMYKLAKYVRNCIIFWKKLHSWQKFQRQISSLQALGALLLPKSILASVSVADWSWTFCCWILSIRHLCYRYKKCYTLQMQSFQLLEYQADVRRCRFDTLGKLTSAHRVGVGETASFKEMIILFEWIFWF